MSEKIRVALLGLGEVGQTFAARFLAKIQQDRMPIEIVAIADHNTDSPVALGFARSGVPVFKHAGEIVRLGERVDIIFDLTGDPKLRKALRLQLQENNNHHTVIAPEMVAQLLYCFFYEETRFPDKHRGRGGY